MEGNINDAHSYLFKFGIHAVTIRGFNSSSDANKKLVISNTVAIARVVEGANRAYMALDEHLHAGSTLYLPINVKKYIST
jgi:glycosylphosphatidylinositol transamidase